MDKNMNCFGTIIRKARESNQLTIDELASKVEISLRYMQKIENEKKIPSYAIIKRLVVALSLDANQLFYDNEEHNDESLEMGIVLNKIKKCDKHNFNVIKATLFALLENDN